MTRVALITGGGRGLGKTIAIALKQAGYALCITGQNRAALEAAAAEIGGRVVTKAFDVSDPIATENAFGELESEVGPISLLVNNAGVAAGGLFAHSDPDAWWRVLEINLRGPMLLTRLVLPSMLANGQGCIINVGSYQGIGPSPGLSAYGVSKAALARFTDTVAAEVAGRGVLLYAVSPGFVRTDMGQEAEAALSDANPDWQGFPAEFIFPPEAIADLIVRIAGGEAAGLEGRLLHVKDDLATMRQSADQIAAQNLLALKLDGWNG